jgi:nicotinate-nucleotide pyrophosphorylase
MTPSQIVERALEEDIGSGDVTTNLCVPADRSATGRFLVREPIVVAGAELLLLLYSDIDLKAPSGTCLEAGKEIAAVRGPAQKLLTRERVALNFLQHLSGIATQARKYVDAVAGTGCCILDTRKTTPGLRELEKMAVRAGGATNHRLGLFDAVLIKNNHITAAGGVRAALDATRNAKKRSTAALKSCSSTTSPPPMAKIGSATSPGARPSSFRAESLSIPFALMPRLARISFPSAPSRIPPEPSTSTSNWSSNNDGL